MAPLAEQLDIRSMITGDVKAVSAQLRAQPAQQAVVITLDHASGEALQALAKALEVAARLFSDTLLRAQQGTIDQIVSLLVPRAPVSPSVLKEAQMLAKAKKAILESGDWLSAGQVAELAGFTSGNPSAQPNRWKHKGKVFALSHNGCDYFPAYGLDQAGGFRPLPAMAQVLDVFAGRKDGWGLAFWFASVNGMLGGKRPQDLLATAADRVIAAAEDEVAGVTHD